MRRLYFLVPEVSTAKKIVDELLLARLDVKHIHVIAREGSELEDLPEATLMQKSDFIPAVERGLALGGATGIFAGLAAMALPGVVIAGGALLGIGLAGAGMGAWIGGMIGLDVNNSRLAQFEKEITEGNILMLVDVPKSRVDDFQALIKKHHPEVDFEGTEPQIPAFP
jgi:hypothetical protein